MGLTTPIFDLPYPVGTDRVRDGDNAIQALAERVETVIAPTLVPTGVVVPFVGSGAPTGWLLAQGQNVSRTTYATLFGVIGTTYGAGDGSTTFGLPDLRSRLPLGEGPGGGGLRARARGAASGGEDSVASHSHYTGGADTDHGHSGSTGGMSAQHVHSYDIGDRSVGALGTGSNVIQQFQSGARTTGGATSDHSHAFSTGGASAGHGHGVNASGSADGNMPPFLVLSYIIKT